MIKTITKNVSKNQDQILSNLDYESVVVYRFLKSEYDKGNILNNPFFQFVFRSFYRMDGAGLSNRMKEHYFQLLENKERNLEIILSELYDIKNIKKQNTIQFSFATKLVHTIDNDMPIYSTEIASCLDKKPRPTGSKNERILSCVVIYGSLMRLYDELKKNEEINDTISKFRLKFNVTEGQISNTKVLDFILWSL